MAMTGHTWRFISRTVLGVLVLFCLILVQMLTDTLVYHDVHQDGVECHDQQMTHVHGASDEQDRDLESSLLASTGSAGPA